MFLCGYSLEPPRRSNSTEYQQSMFLSRNKKNNVYPTYKPQFYYIKVGFKGSKLYRYVFVMEPYFVVKCFKSSVLSSRIQGVWNTYGKLVVYVPVKRILWLHSFNKNVPARFRINYHTLDKFSRRQVDICLSSTK